MESRKRKVMSAVLVGAGALLAGLAIAGGSLAWVKIYYGNWDGSTGWDDRPNSILPAGSVVYVAGHSNLNVTPPYNRGFVHIIDPSTGASLGVQSFVCENAPFGYYWAYTEDVAKSGTTVYAVGHSRCGGGGSVCVALGGNKKCQASTFDGDAFLFAFDASTPTQLNPIWGESQQSDGEDKAEGVATYGSNLYVAGKYSGSHLKVRGKTITALQNQGSFDLYLVRYSTSGAYLGAVGVGGSDDDALTNTAGSVSVDSAGNVYFTGYIRSNPAYVYKYSGGTRTVLATLYKVGGGSDVFVIKFDPSLNFLWGKVLGGPGDDKGIAVVASGSDVYVAGFYEQYLSLPGCCTLWSKGGRDGFGVLLRASDGAPQGGITLGGSATDEAASLKVIPSTGRVAITGFFSGTMTVGSYTLTSRGGRDAFFVEVDRYGNVFSAASAGGSADDEGTALGAYSNVVIGGISFKSNPIYLGSLSYPHGSPGSNSDLLYYRLNMF